MLQIPPEKKTRHLNKIKTVQTYDKQTLYETHRSWNWLRFGGTIPRRNGTSFVVWWGIVGDSDSRRTTLDGPKIRTQTYRRSAASSHWSCRAAEYSNSHVLWCQLILMNRWTYTIILSISRTCSNKVLYESILICWWSHWVLEWRNQYWVLVLELSSALHQPIFHWFSTQFID